MALTCLVPLDGSPLSEGILPHLSLLGASLTRLVLLRVVTAGPDVEAAQEERETEDAQAYLAEVRGRLAQDAALPEVERLEARILRGDPAEQILSAAEVFEPDLVAMASHGRSGLLRWIRGSVAERVLRSCGSPLLLSTPHTASPGEGGPPRFRRVLVPLDGSPHAERILPLVAVVARAHGAEVTLLRVEPFVPAEVPSPVLHSARWDPEALVATLGRARRTLSEAGLQVDARAVTGVEAGEILGAAEGADLVAMCTHGRSGLSRWWFGSVAEQVFRECPRPLLVLRSGAEPGPAEARWRELAEAQAQGGQGS